MVKRPEPSHKGADNAPQARKQMTGTGLRLMTGILGVVPEKKACVVQDGCSETTIFKGPRNPEAADDA